MPIIRVSAAIIRNRDGEFLLVRKKGTTAFMFPGGKPEPGETPDQTLIRELDEELNLRVGTEDLTFVGTFRTNAANEANTQLLADVFTLDGSLRWIIAPTTITMATTPTSAIMTITTRMT